MNNELEKINKKIICCKKCPRLVHYISFIAKTKVKRFSDQKYWGKPLTGFGDPKARLLLIGLAPAAHGGNRTGRMFTGDSSGDWLAKVLYENSFSTKPSSQRIGDGFELVDTYVTASIRCAPPQNKPLKEEIENCSDYLKTELKLLGNVKVIICLGKIAFDSCCKLLHVKGIKFAHGKSFTQQNYTIICSYHPSRQNTQTGRLTWAQWSQIFSRARKVLDDIK
jgi:uracil-DNA glycosylase family 4